MSLRSLTLAGSFVLALSGAALSQTPSAGTPPASAPGGAVTTPQSNSTGAAGATTVSPNGNPADSKSTDSAAGSNAGQPSRAAPQGSSGK